jgi:hypothetical protein
MWIQHQNKNCKALKTPEIDELVTFNDNGTAQVNEDTAQALINNYEQIEEKGSE